MTHSDDEDRDSVFGVEATVLEPRGNVVASDREYLDYAALQL